MIVEWIYTSLQHFIQWIIGMLPSFDVVNYSVLDTFALMAKPLSIFPIDMFDKIIANGIGWMIVLLAWSIFEWVYKKIPGVD